MYAKTQAEHLLHGHDPRPLDLATMRAAADELLADDAPMPTRDHLETLLLQYRGHLMLLIPEVADAAVRHDNPVLVAAATAGIAEARRRLDEEPSGVLPKAIAYGQRLARSIRALTTHIESLTGAHHA